MVVDEAKHGKARLKMMEEALAEHNNPLNQFFFQLKLLSLHDLMFISPGMNMVNLKNKPSSLLINMLLSWLQVLLWHNLSAFGNSHSQFGLTSCFTGLIRNIFNAPPFDLGPFRHKALQKSLSVRV